jgi:hypothetical protein
MNSIIAIALGAIAGGVVTSMYYGRKLNSIITSLIDTKTVNRLLKEYTAESDEKRKSKDQKNSGPTKKRVPANRKSKKS